MHVDRHPRGVEDRVPQLDGHRVRRRRDVARRRHHVGEPRVGDQHHHRAPHVQHDAEGPVPQLRPPVLPAIPAVIVEVEGERLEEEQPRVRPHRGAEHPRQIRPEPRIQTGEQEHEDRAPDRRSAVGHEQEPCKLLREPVVAALASEDPDRFRHHREHRHAQHEGGEHQVDLGGDPDRRPGPDHRELAVGADRVRGGRDHQQAVSHQPRPP